MDSPKGKKHREFTQEEKVQYVEQHYKSHKSGRPYAIETGLDYNCFCRWLKSYRTEGVVGLASHRNRCGNRYAALHSSMALNELWPNGKAGSRCNSAKKGYQTKGSGSRKEFVTGNGKSFKSSKV